MASKNIDTATALLRGVWSGDPDLATRGVSPDGLVQHDPFVADGVVGLREQAERSAGGYLAIARVLEDGPFVVAHGRSGPSVGGEVFFAVFRFENAFVVEQWRFATPAAAHPNESGYIQTDGPIEPDGTLFHTRGGADRRRASDGF